jgi:hypothetical protein
VTSAPSVRRPGRTFHPFSRLKCCVPVLLCAVAGALAFTAAPALAATPPEARTEGPSEVKAESAVLNGVVNPEIAEPVEAGKYQFLYKATKTATEAECLSAGASKAPAVAEPYLGVMAEPFPEEVKGLKPNTEYVVCFVAVNNAKEKTVGAPVPFQTTPEKPEAGKVKVGSITATAVELEGGVLNPKVAGEGGEYQYVYKVSATECEGEGAAPETAGKAAGLKKEAVPTVRLTNLQPNATYTVCLIERDAGGSSLASTPVTVKTLLVSPPEIEPGSLKAANVKASEVTLEGTVNPDNEPTECYFEYGTSLPSGVTIPCTPELLKGYGGQGVSSTRFNEQGQVTQSITGLASHTTYKYRLVAKNGAGEGTKEATFKTAIALETPVEEKAEPVHASTATLKGILNPAGERTEEPGTYEFVYRQSATECKGQGEKATSSTAATGEKEEKVSAPVSELLPGTQYTFCLLARNEAGEEALGSPETFTTPAVAPTPGEEFATKASSDSVILHAQVNPGGIATTYRFEYLTEAEFQADGESFTGPDRPTSIPSPEGNAGSGAGAVEVQAEAQGLSPATTYHYRVVLSNHCNAAKPAELCTSEGRDATFNTQSASTTFALPDGRAYEMVSPPQKEGAAIQHGLPGIFEAATGGNAFTYITKVPTESAPAGYDNQSQDLSTRGPSGWTTRDLSASHELSTSANITEGPEYRFFSSDLSRAIAQPLGLFTPCVSSEGKTQPCLSPEASEPTALLEDTGTHTFTPFVTGCPAAGAPCPALVSEHANVPAGTVFGGVQEGNENKECIVGPYCGPYFVAGTPDLSHVLLESDIGLTEGPGAEGGLYQASAGKLTFVGKGENEAGFDSVSNQGAYAAHGAHGISENGLRVIFKGKAEGPHGEALDGLLMRETTPEDEEKGRLGEAVSLGEGEPQAESADDSRVFFDTHWNGEIEAENKTYGENKPLTGQLDVWEQASKPGEPLAGKVTDLTEGTDGFRGLVLGASEDGSYVYFVSAGVLAGSGATTEGDANLYVDHYSGTTWKATFITALSSEDGYDWDTAPEWDVAYRQNQPTRVSPDGRWLAFMSQAPLTGSDDRDARTGMPDAEVYEYDAEGNGGAGSLSCASCDPTGARPVGIEYGKISANSDEAEAGTTEAWPDQALVAANLPGSHGLRSAALAINYQPRFLSDGGRLFFNSEDALVPLDVNGTEDVYEYEPASEGAGNCEGTASSTGSRTFEPASRFEVEVEGTKEKGESGAGCVGLISSGTSSEESAFLDASEGGGEGEHGEVGTQGGADVFFLTSAKLSPQDQDTAYDVYDAHECTTASPCISPSVASPPCDTEASCKASPTPQPPIYGAGPSEVFSGPGNLTPPTTPAVKTKTLTRTQKLAAALKTCRKKTNKKKRTSCEKTAHKDYGPAKTKKTNAKKASNGRRATR